MTVFDKYARYYALLYRDKDYAGEAGFVQQITARLAPGAKTILELGCGGGKHAVELVRMGFSVHGIDRSREMLADARERIKSLAGDQAGRLTVEEGDVRTFKTDRRFDAVVSLFHVVSYQPTDDDLRATFATAAEHLDPGGLFLFDCWYGPTVLHEPPQIRIKRMADEELSVTRLCEPETLPEQNSVVCKYTVFVEEKATQAIAKIEESHRMRYLFTPEVQGFFSGAGMDMVACGEWMTDREPGQDTFSVYFAGRKTANTRG